MPEKRGGKDSSGIGESANDSTAVLLFQAKLSLAADYVFANQPFNDSDWFRQDAAVRAFSLSASTGDLSCLGSNERNLPAAKARRGQSEWTRARHWVGVRCRNHVLPKGNDNFVRVRHFIPQSRTLVILCDTLLPKLLRGELRVAKLQN